MAAGWVVVLNGAPRSGKSSIAAVIQETFDGPWMNLGVDVFSRHVTPPRYRPGMGLRPGGGERPDIEALIPALYAAFYDSIAAHARHGLDGGDQRVGQPAVGEVHHHVVDGDAATALEDVQGHDVDAGLAQCGRDGAQDAGLVGHYQAQEIGHGSSGSSSRCGPISVDRDACSFSRASATGLDAGCGGKHPT